MYGPSLILQDQLLNYAAAAATAAAAAAAASDRFQVAQSTVSKISNTSD